MTETTIRRAGTSDADVVLTMVREIAEHQDEAQYVTSSLEDWRRSLARDDVMVLIGMPHSGTCAAGRARGRRAKNTKTQKHKNTGIIQVAGQQVALGREYKWQTVTIHVSETTPAIELPDAETRTVRRTTDQAVRSIKGQRPRTADASVS